MESLPPGCGDLQSRYRLGRKCFHHLFELEPSLTVPMGAFMRASIALMCKSCKLVQLVGWSNMSFWGR
eukprot:scaffold2620_cov143-Skeletonema_menzelii.AAC.10